VSTIARGTKNAFRNTIRTVSIVVILALSFGLALVMLLSVQAVNTRTAAVSASVGTTISVTPAGSQGFGGGGNPLTSTDVAKIASTTNVRSVVSAVSDRLGNSSASSFRGTGTGGTTSLTSAITPGTLGRRFGGGNSTTGAAPPANFTLPVQVTGSTQPLSAALLGSNSVTLTSGSAINGSSSALVADVGTTLAAKNNLKVGSTFTAYGKTITVAGIFDAKSVFVNGGFVMPLDTVQDLSGISGVTTVIAQVGSIDQLATTAASIQSTLGSQVATVTTGQTNDATIISSLSSIKTIALYSLIGALVAGSIILFLSMLMIVRERRREIGILKAFGSSNVGVVRLFVTEAFTLTAMGAIAGVVLGVLLSNPVLKVLVNNSSTTPAPGGFGAGPGRAVALGNPLGFGRSTLSDLHAAVGYNVLIFGVLAAVLIAFVGSAIPSYLIAKVRPAEVLRGE
jgi:putative ABC transport system permease protein